MLDPIPVCFSVYITYKCAFLISLQSTTACDSPWQQADKYYWCGGGKSDSWSVLHVRHTFLELTEPTAILVYECCAQRCGKRSQIKKIQLNCNSTWPTYSPIVHILILNRPRQSRHTKSDQCLSSVCCGSCFLLLLLFVVLLLFLLGGGDGGVLNFYSKITLCSGPKKW